MTRLMVAMMSAAFSLFAIAQTPAQGADAAKKDKQEMVKATTESAQKAQAVKSAEGSAEAAKTKHTPKALNSKTEKQQTVKAATESAQKAQAVKASEGSAKAAADTSPRVPPPKPTLEQKEIKKAGTN